MGEEAQDRLTEAIMERVNATGRAFLSHTKLRGRFCLRVSIGNLRTTEEHVLRVWRLLREAAAEVHPEGAGR
jgi:aromatic-L-amino-acid decarboxylase